MGNLTFGQQSGLNSLTSVANGLVGGAIGLAQSALQHKYNRDLATYQNDMNIRNWNMQNEYNSPIKQRQRLEDAGLNPALMYGNGGGSTGNATQTPQYQQTPLDIIGAMQNAMLTDAQIRQMGANIEKTKAETKGIETSNQFIAEKERAIIDNTLSQTEVNRGLVKKYEKEISKMDIEIDSIKTSMDVMLEEISLKKAQSDSIKEQTNLTKLQQLTESLQQGLIKAQTVKTEQDAITSSSQAYMYDAYATQAEANEGNINAETVYKEARNAFYQKYGVFPDAQGDAFLMQIITSDSDGLGGVRTAYAVREGAKVAKDIGIALGVPMNASEQKKNRNHQREEGDKNRENRKEVAKIIRAYNIARAIGKKGK